MKKLYFISPLLVALSLSNIEAQPTSSVPKLVVNIVIDQLRSDYMQAFMPLYGERGFKRLLKDARVYTQAQYPLDQPDRASAMATLVTGTTPYNHGVVGEEWLDRNTLRPVYCVEDKAYDGIMTVDKSSPRNLWVSTISDELKIATAGKSIVYSLSPFRDAAILGAGHAADGALWIDDLTGMWCGTSFYGKSLPTWAGVQNQYHSLNKIIADKEWTPSSDLVGNFSYFLSGGMKKPFVHKFKGTSRFRTFKTSGLVNEYVLDLAKACLSSSSLGNDAVTDYLSLTLYGGNFDHRPVSDYPIEMQDIYVRLDRVLGELIDAVDSKVGTKNTLFVITSTGHTDNETADLSIYNIPTGTLYINRTAALLNMYLVAMYGAGQYVDRYHGSEIYLNHKLLEEKQLSLTDVLNRVQDFLIQVSGVKDVFTSQRLLLGAWTPGINHIRNSYNPKCSGDVLIQVSPGWRLSNETTQETKLIRESYIPFPIFFYGADIRPEHIDTPVTMDCIAPTLAQAMRIRAPNACSTPPLFGQR